MTTIRKTLAMLCGAALVATLTLAGRAPSLSAKEICWEECTFELMGGCWRWKKACLDLSQAQREAGHRADSTDRSPSRQQIPSHIDSLLAGGGLSTALNNDARKAFGRSHGMDVLQ